MKTLHAAAILLAVALPACHKVPYGELVRELTASGTENREQAQKEPVNPASTPAETVAKSASLPAIDRHARLIVLGYHRFVDKVRHPDTEITTAEFESQMQALKDQGISVISLDDFLAWRKGQKDIPAQSALITIDDGYNSAYYVAWPILKEFGYPFTLFIYTDYVRGGPKAGGGSMTWDQLAEMRDAGVSIQSHTVSHSDLRHKKAGAPEATYDEWLWKELHDSRRILEDHLGIQVSALALPFGLANDHVREVAAKAGYEMVFTVNGQQIGYATPMESLNRYMVQANKPQLFVTATNFEGAAGHTAAQATAAVPLADIRPFPADQSAIADPSPLIRASLAGLGAIDPDSVTLRISGLGEVTPRFDPKTQMLTYRTHALPPSKYTVILGAKSQGKKIESRWSFTVAPVDTPPATIAAGPHR